MDSPNVGPRRFSVALAGLITRLVLPLVAIILIQATACGSPSGPDASLVGDWWTGPLPSGGGISLSLTTSGAAVTGNGQSREAGPNGATHLIIVAGSYSGRDFVLTCTFDSGSTATYSGQVVDANTLAGQWSAPGQPTGSLTLYRR